MANEAVYKFGAQKTLEANGNLTSSFTFMSANDTTMTASDHNDYTLIDFVMSATFSVAPTAGEVINLYAKALDIDGTADAPDPSANYLSLYLGSFLVAPVTTLQYLPLLNIALPCRTFECYIENRTSQSISAGWTLKATPKTIGPY